MEPNKEQEAAKDEFQRPKKRKKIYQLPMATKIKTSNWLKKWTSTKRTQQMKVGKIRCIYGSLVTISIFQSLKMYIPDEATI